MVRLGVDGNWVCGWGSWCSEGVPNGETCEVGYRLRLCVYLAAPECDFHGYD